jgi:hypothetical protein
MWLPLSSCLLVLMMMDAFTTTKLERVSAGTTLAAGLDTPILCGWETSCLDVTTSVWVSDFPTNILAQKLASSGATGCRREW